MSEDETQEPKPIGGIHPQGLGFFMALPLVVPMLIVLTDINGFAIALAYGLIVPVMIIVIVVAIIYLAAEAMKRKRFKEKKHRVASFWLLGVVCCVALPFFPGMLRPLVMTNPKWCRVSQVIDWETSAKDAEGDWQESYVLVLNGRGNLKNHTLDYGWLNWTGEGAAGFSDVNAAEMELSMPGEGYESVDVPATFESIQERMMNSGLPAEEVDAIAADMMAVLELAQRGEPISSRLAEVDPMHEMTWDGEDELFGIWLWILMVFGSYQWVAWATLPRPSSTSSSEAA